MKHFNFLRQALLPLLVMLAVVIPAAAQPLNGTYTVYGASPNYTSLSAAISDLNSKGVSGPVTIKVRPGTHTMSGLTINNITGASATNRVTIESENGSHSTTVIRNTSTSSSSTQNFVFRFNGAKYVTVKNLGLEKTSSSYGRCVVFEGASQYDIVDGCRLYGSTSRSSSTSRSRVYANSVSQASNNIITNCKIEYGAHAIYWRGSSSSSSGTSDNNEFSNNECIQNGYYGIYTYYTDGTKVLNNTINNTLSSYFYAVYMGYAYGTTQVNNNKGSLTGKTSSVYPIYMYYCEGNSTTNVMVENNEFTGSTSSSVYPSYNYYCKYLTYKGNKIDLYSSGFYSYGYIYSSYYGNDNTIENNDIKSNVNYYTWGYLNYRSKGTKMNYNKFDLKTRSYYTYAYSVYYSDDAEAKGNEMKLDGYRGCYNYFPYGCSNYVVDGNTIDAYSQLGSCYAAYAYSYGTNNGVFANNILKAESKSTSSWNSIYGAYLYYAKNVNIYNNAVWVKGNGRPYALYIGYATNTNVHNNTFHVESTSSNGYAAYIYNYGSQYSTDFKNNVFSKSSNNGFAVYSRFDDNVTMDYNLYAKASGGLITFANKGGYSSIQALRNATNHGDNSLTYVPAFMNQSTGDLRPDPSAPASWALNGRGVQVAGNNKDITGAARAETTVQGVPDLGAYEFTPTATPPNCTAIPAAATAGSTQTFLFGQDTVATIAWATGSTVPSTIDMKQYTGTNPPGITSINPTQMFYYVDAGFGTGTHDYNLNLYYKDPAMGTIASEAALRLAEKVGTNAWSPYSPAVSNSNTIRNYISTPNLTKSGLWTGIDVSDNASADVIIDPVSPFCPGTYNVKLRVKNSGNNKINSLKVTWQENGVTKGTINYNNTIDINGSANGNEAIIPLGNVTFANSTVNLKAWTHAPNNKVDPVPGDDTLTAEMHAALAGNYTIGGTTPNYPVVSDAITDLNKYGICGNVNFDIRPGTYAGQLVLGKVNGTGSNARITFQAENGDNSSVTVTASPTNFNDAYIWKLDDAEYVTIKNITVTTSSSSYGRLIEFTGAPKHDSITNCRLICTSNTTFYHSVIYANNVKGKDITIHNNVMEKGYYSIYFYGNSGSYTDGLDIIGNDISESGYMGMYIPYSASNTKVNYNKLYNPTTNAYYGVYWYMYGMPAGVREFIGNNISGTFRGYGVYSYYNDGTASNHLKVMNNTVAVHNPSNSSNYAVLFSYNKYMDVINNSFYMNSTNSNSYAAYFYHSSSTYRDITVRNNVFVGKGSSKSIYFYRVSSTQTYDYNNFYTENGNTLLVYNGSARNSLAAYRSASGQGDHSLTYEPGFMGNTDLRPDPANPNSWSLNGRGVHIAGNTTDINMDNRVDKRADGVPDIGAYEFEPTSLPPAAIATPALPAPGVTQVFTFGGNEVAQITWNKALKLTSPITVRQYSGRRAPGVNTATPQSAANNMYFYTNIDPSGPGKTYNFDVKVNYMDIWLGTIAQENELKLAHHLAPNPWVVYGGTLSSVNTGSNVISGTGLTSFGNYTGLQNGSIFSSFVTPSGSTVFCYGDTVTLNAIHTSSGGTYSYEWRLNNNTIPGATSDVYKTTQPGDYTVVITEVKNGNTKKAQSIPITVTAVAPPMALVNASGPLTYCTGSNLVLYASTGNGLVYQWALNGVDIAGANSSTYTIKQPGNYSVKVENIGCFTESIVTPVTSGPLVVNLGADTSFCEVKNVPLYLDAGFPGAKYTWNTGDTTRTISPKVSGDYYVTVNGGVNCIDTDTIQVNIDPLPSANGISYVKAGNNYTFSPSGPQNANSYLWLFSDGSSSTNKVVNKNVSDPNLHIRLVMYNNCGSDTITLGFPLNVTNVSGEAAISLYPNPASEQITLNISGDIELNEVSVINAVGQVMYHNTEVKSNEMKLDVSGYTNGHYMLRVTTKDGAMLSKPFNVMK
ncbi:MAG: T9SS type A sorting domain-containing protein [Flavipsychrobacter sp.]